VFVCWLELPRQSVHITTNVSLNPVHDEVYTIQHYVIKFVSNLRQVSRWFSPGTPVSSSNKTDRHDITEIRWLDYLTNHISLPPIRRGFAPGFVNYKKRCTRLAAASDTIYQLLAHGRWFSPCTPASSTTKTGRHDIAEILLKLVLNTNKNKNK